MFRIIGMSYKTAYGKRAILFRLMLYDAMRIIADAVKNWRGDNSECIKSYLYKVKRLSRSWRYHQF